MEGELGGGGGNEERPPSPAWERRKPSSRTVGLSKKRVSETNIKIPKSKIENMDVTKSSPSKSDDVPTQVVSTTPTTSTSSQPVSGPSSTGTALKESNGVGKTGFMLASGKQVEISEEGLKRAKLLFGGTDEKDPDALPIPPEFFEDLVTTPANNSTPLVSTPSGTCVNLARCSKNKGGFSPPKKMARIESPGPVGSPKTSKMMIEDGMSQEILETTMLLLADDENDPFIIEDDVPEKPKPIAIKTEAVKCYSRPSKGGLLRIGKPAPAWRTMGLVNGSFKEISSDDYKGKYLVLFFYPLDFTFVCPTEIISFSERVASFRQIGCEVVACSTDSHFSHIAWVNTPRKDGGLGQINIPLLSDKAGDIAKSFGVYKDDEGIAFRGLFIIDPKQNLRTITVHDLPIGRSVDETLRVVQAIQFYEKNGEVCPAGWKPGDKTIKPDWKGSKEYFSTKK